MQQANEPGSQSVSCRPRGAAGLLSKLASSSTAYVDKLVTMEFTHSKEFSAVTHSAKAR
jgi:hypothetical protein